MVMQQWRILLNLALAAVVQCKFMVQMPSSLDVVNGSCVLIPCGFSIPEDHKQNLRLPVGGVWRKDSRWFADSTDVFNSSHHVNQLHGEIIGDLLQKNCTSILYNFTSNYAGIYYFRLETGLKYTFETPVHIRVLDHLPKPRLSHARVSVNEDKQVELTCTSLLPCPLHRPHLSWMPQLGNSTETMEKQEDGTYILTSTLRFISSHAHDGERVNCSVDHRGPEGPSVSEEPITITVLYAPKTEVGVSWPGPLYEGSEVSMICSADANPSVTGVRWFREWWGTAQEINTTETNLTLRMSNDTAGLYYCEAQNSFGGQNSSKVLLEVKERPLVDSFETLRVVTSSAIWLLGGCGAALTLIILFTAALGFKRSSWICKRSLMKMLLTEARYRAAFTQEWSVGDSQLYANFDNTWCSNKARQDCKE